MNCFFFPSFDRFRKPAFTDEHQLLIPHTRKRFRRLIDSQHGIITFVRKNKSVPKLVEMVSNFINTFLLLSGSPQVTYFSNNRCVCRVNIYLLHLLPICKIRSKIVVIISLDKLRKILKIQSIIFLLCRKKYSLMLMGKFLQNSCFPNSPSSIHDHKFKSRT